MKKERNMDRKYRFVSGSSSAIGRETRNPETRFGTCLIPVHWEVAVAGTKGGDGAGQKTQNQRFFKFVDIDFDICSQRCR